MSLEIANNWVWRLFKPLCLLFFLAASSSWAFDVKVSASSVALNKTIQLSVTSYDQTDLNQLDLSTLDTDFIVSSPDISSVVNIINGQRTSRQTLTVTLKPRKVGQLRIPSFRIGKRASKPITINVNDPIPLPDELYDGVIKAEVELSKPVVVVNESVVYSVKLFYMIDQESGFSGLSIPHAQIDVLEPKVYRDTLQGQQYLVQEQRYVITPQKAQNISITSPIIKGQIYQNGRRLFRSHGIPFEVQAKPLKLQVKSLPGSIAPNTLVAEGLKISDAPLQTNVFSVGEPITRRITIEAKGVKAESLPKVIVNEQNGLNVYQEPPEFHNEEWLGGYAGRRTETYALVPTTDGVLTLPRVEFEWWDTKSNTLQLAVLPSQQLTILPSKNNPSGNSKKLSNDNAIINSSQTNKETSSPSARAAETPLAQSDIGNSEETIPSLLLWQLSTALLGLLVAVLLHWIYRFKKSANALEMGNEISNPTAESRFSSKELIEAITQAYRNDDIQSCKTALNHYILWRNDAFPNTHALISELDLALDLLNQHLYGSDRESSSQWQQYNIPALAQQDLAHCQHQARELQSSANTLTQIYPA